MPDPTDTPPQSFEDLAARLQAEEAGSSPDILPKTPDGAQDATRSEEPAKKAPEAQPKPEPTTPKDTEPKAKDTDPKEPKAKEAERQDRSWKKLAEEREKDRLAREELAREKATIAQERAEMARAKAEAGQQPPPKTDTGTPELTVESLTALAARKRAAADSLRAKGEFAAAEAAQKVAEEAEEYAQTLKQQQPAPKGSSEPQPGSPEFQAEQRRVADLIAQKQPDLKNPDSPLSKATALALKAIPHLQRTPDGVAGAVAVAEVLLDRNLARASESALKTQVETLTKQLAEANARIAGAPPGGGAGNPPTTPDLGNLTGDDAWAELRRRTAG